MTENEKKRTTGTTNSQRILKNNKLEASLPDFKIYYRDIVLKQYGNRKKQTDI